MTHSCSRPTRRGFLAAAGSTALLAACGGGGGGDPAPVPRDPFTVLPTRFTASQHTATLAQDGRVILAGGSRGLATLSDGVDRFDPATGTVTRIGSLAAGRCNHRATRLADGRILVTGGLRSSGDTRQAELVDERTGAVSATGSMSVARVEHAALALPGGRVLVTGGNSSGERVPLGISDSAELWDPATGQFRRLDVRMAVGRSGHTMTLLADGRVLVVGGYSVTAPYVLAEIFDPGTERFTPVAGPSALRASHHAHLDAQGRVLVLGGETVDGGGAPQPLASVLRYDPAGNAWSELPPLRTPRTWAATVLAAEGSVLLLGGQESLPRYTASAERYSPATGGTPLANLDGERALHTATRLPDGRVLVAGGEAFGGAYVTTMLLLQPV